MILACEILASYFIVLFLLLLNENRLIFRPSRTFIAVPADLGLEAEEVFFTSKDNVTLHGWLFKSREKAPYLLFCHGNAGNISDRLWNVMLLLKVPLNVFIFDYRGYGKSSGKPTEQGVYDDARAAWDYLQWKHGLRAEEIAVFGRSLGGAIAIDLAVHRPVKSLILESTFVSLKELVKRIFPYFLFYPFLPSKFRNDEKIGKLKIPVFIIHGRDDRTVPWTQGRRLYEMANEPKRFWPVDGARHTDVFEVCPAEYLETIRGFILTNTRRVN